MSEGQIAHVLLTRSPLVYPRKGLTARLACVKHAASVRPEPGSNSPLKNNTTPNPKRPDAEKEIPAEDRYTDKKLPESIYYQRNRQLTPQPQKAKEIIRRIKLIRRLYDTLLSSQTSDTHHRNPHGPHLGQPAETYRLNYTDAHRFHFSRPRHLPTAPM
jgi:hypothetical protein